MATNKLNDARCRSAKPGDKPIKLSDGEGLFLYVTPAGSKLWRLAYRFDGKQKLLSFGAYPGTSLQAAREARALARARLAGGEDPGTKQSSRRSMTLLDASASYWATRLDLSDSYRQYALRGIELHLASIGQRDVRGITRDDLMGPLNAMNAAGKFNYLRKVRMWAGQVFDWCVEQQLADMNPAALINPKKAFGTRKTEHMPALTPEELPAFMAVLSQQNQHLVSVLACRFMAYTWVRTKEVRFMPPDEIDGDTWRLPPGRMKRNRWHVVPLSRQAQDVLQRMLAISNGGRYVFAESYSPNKAMSENAILALIARMGFKGRMTGHGWRAVASTWANERGYSPDVIERQLAHEPGNKTRAAYNRAEYLDERRRMLQDWADWLDACEADAGSGQR